MRSTSDLPVRADPHAQGASPARLLYGVRMLVTAALALAVLAGCDQRKLTPPRGGIDGTGLPDQESWQSHITFSDSGRVKAVVEAGHIRMYDERHETLLDSGVVVDFYDSRGLHSSRLTADRGRVDDATKDLEAFDNVVFTSDSGTVVRTEYLYWENARRKVRSDRFVHVKSAKEELQGYGFEADQNLKNYVIYRVSGQAELIQE